MEWGGRGPRYAHDVVTFSSVLPGVDLAGLAAGADLTWLKITEREREKEKGRKGESDFTRRIIFYNNCETPVRCLTSWMKPPEVWHLLAQCRGTEQKETCAVMFTETCVVKTNSPFFDGDVLEGFCLAPFSAW